MKLGLKSQPQLVTGVEVHSVASESVKPSQAVRCCESGYSNAVSAGSRVFLFPSRPELQVERPLWHQVLAWQLAFMRAHRPRLAATMGSAKLVLPLTCKPLVMKLAERSPSQRPSKGFSPGLGLRSKWSKICAVLRLQVPQSRPCAVKSASGFKSRKPSPFFFRSFRNADPSFHQLRPALGNGMCLMAGRGSNRRTARNPSQVHLPVPLRALLRRTCAHSLRPTEGLSHGWVLFRSSAKTSMVCRPHGFTSGSRPRHLSTALSFPRWSGSVAQKRLHGRWRLRVIRRLLAPVPVACRCRLDYVTLSRVTYGCAAILASFSWGIARLVACGSDPLPLCLQTHVLSVGWLPGMAAYNQIDPLSVPPRICSKEAKRLLFVRRTRPLRLLLSWILNPLEHRTGLTKSGSSLAVAPVCRPKGYKQNCSLTHMSFRLQRRWTCGFRLRTTHAPQLSLQRCAFVSAGGFTNFGSCTLELRSANCKMLPRVLRRGLDKGWLQLVVVVTTSFLRSRCRLAPACVRVLIGSPQSRLVLSVAGLRAVGRQTFLPSPVHASLKLGQPAVRHWQTNSHEFAVLIERFIRNVSMWPASLGQLRDLPAVCLPCVACGMQLPVVPCLLWASAALDVPLRPFRSLLHTAHVDIRLRTDGLWRLNRYQGPYLVLLGRPLSLQRAMRRSDAQMSFRRTRLRKVIK